MRSDRRARSLCALALWLLSLACAQPDRGVRFAEETCKAAFGVSCAEILQASKDRQTRARSPAVLNLMSRFAAGELPQASLEPGASGRVARDGVVIRLFDGMVVPLVPAGTELPAHAIQIAFPLRANAQVLTLEYVIAPEADVTEGRRFATYRLLLFGNEADPAFSIPPVAVEADVDVDGRVYLAETPLLPEVGPRFRVAVPNVGMLTFPTYAEINRSSVKPELTLEGLPRLRVGPR